MNQLSLGKESLPHRKLLQKDGEPSTSLQKQLELVAVGSEIGSGTTGFILPPQDI